MKPYKFAKPSLLNVEPRNEIRTINLPDLHAWDLAIESSPKGMFCADY